MDPTDHRLKDLIATHSSPETLVTLMGYPDDQGILLNKGRTGAALAPEKIREIFLKMTPTGEWPKSPFIFDAGNLEVDSKDLESKQQKATEKVFSHFQMSKSFLVTLGGGHDYAYPDGAGFLRHFLNSKGEKPLIVNFDAHLDVRPVLGTANSGTPFRQLLTEFPNQFDLVEVGIREHCNSFEHLSWARTQKVKVIGETELKKFGLLKALKSQVKPNKKRPLFLSIDIDGFCSSLAPGCSAAWPGGLLWPQFEPALNWLLNSFSAKSLGIYEVSPPLDENLKTSRLAALLMYRTLSQILPKTRALAAHKKKR